MDDATGLGFSSASDFSLLVSPWYPEVLEARRLEPQSIEKNGGRGWDRTSDPYDVNVVLSR